MTDKKKICENAISRLEKEKNAYEAEIIELKEKIAKDSGESAFVTRTLKDQLYETEQALLVVKKSIESQNSTLEKFKQSEGKAVL